MNKNNINEKLKKLSILDKVDISEMEDGDYYISLKESTNDSSPVAIVEEDGSVNYYLSNCYNSGIDNIRIDMNELTILTEVIKEILEW